MSGCVAVGHNHNSSGVAEPLVQGEFTVFKMHNTCLLGSPLLSYLVLFKQRIYFEHDLLIISLQKFENITDAPAKYLLKIRNHIFAKHGHVCICWIYLWAFMIFSTFGENTEKW